MHQPSPPMPSAWCGIIWWPKWDVAAWKITKISNYRKNGKFAAIIAWFRRHAVFCNEEMGYSSLKMRAVHTLLQTAIAILWVYVHSVNFTRYTKFYFLYFFLFYCRVVMRHWPIGSSDTGISLLLLELVWLWLRFLPFSWHFVCAIRLTNIVLWDFKLIVWCILTVQFKHISIHICYSCTYWIPWISVLSQFAILWENIIEYTLGIFASERAHSSIRTHAAPPFPSESWWWIRRSSGLLYQFHMCVISTNVHRFWLFY